MLPSRMLAVFLSLFDLGIWGAQDSGCFTDMSNTGQQNACNDLIMCSIYKHTLFSMEKLLVVWNS